MNIIENSRQRKILEKKGICTFNDVLNLLPKTYKDYRSVFRRIEEADHEKEGCFIGVLKFLSEKFINKTSYISFKLYTENRPIRVTIIGQHFQRQLYEQYEYDKKCIAVFGKITYDEQYGFNIMNPDHITLAEHADKYIRLMPIYKKIEGISEETMNKVRETAFLNFIDYRYDSLLEEKYGFDKLPSTKEAYEMIHNPKSLMDTDSAKRRLDVNELLEFAIKLHEQESLGSTGTAVTLSSLTTTSMILNSLPYDLTLDQMKYLHRMIKNIRNGKRVSALLQGDVGCGKTMVAILMLFAMAENGYQGVVMAPTSILAGQHYEQIKEYAKKYGIKAAYLDGSVKGKDKKSVLESIRTGETKIVVGTHSLASDKVIYHKLGLAIIDEEHRFGSEQRNQLLKYAQDGTNTILMSATPIPRTLAATIYGGSTDILDIRTMPSNRKPVQTAINNSDRVVFDFIENQLLEGRQAYVVCPLIERKEDSKLADTVLSVEETAQMYREHFEPFYKVAVLNGKMKDEELTKVINDFKTGNTHILISTTVVEVGVNVPNTSVMVIQNAERFGLSTMHQLRGRVGRGDYKGYCILKSADKTNPRLNIMCRCNNGFEIAEEDLKLRGAGDLIGIKQSGTSHIMDLILENKELFEKCSNMAKEIVEQKNGLAIFA